MHHILKISSITLIVLAVASTSCNLRKKKKNSNQSSDAQPFNLPTLEELESASADSVEENGEDKPSGRCPI